MKTTRFYILLALLLMAVFPSCAIIEINGLGNDYNDLDESHKALVRPLESFEEVPPGLVYKLAMPMLKEELEHQPKAVVRVFNAACRGNACKPLSVFQQYAQENVYLLLAPSLLRKNHPIIRIALPFGDGTELPLKQGLAQGRDAVHVDMTFQMIVLMLDDPGLDAGEFLLMFLKMLIEVFDTDAIGTHHLLKDAW